MTSYEMAGGDGQRAGSGAVRPVTQTAGTTGLHNARQARYSGLEVRLQPERIKTGSPSPRQAGKGRGGGGKRAEPAPYVHTPKGSSSGQIFEGTTEQYIEELRNHKRAKNIIAAYLSMKQCGRLKQAQALLSCAKWFRRIDFPCGTYRLVPMHCDSPFCPECAGRRSKPLQKRIAKRMNYTKHDYWHLTITVLNWLTLTSEGLSELIAQFATLRARQLWKDFVTGGVYSVECIWSDDTKWHPHFHVLLETPKRLPMWWIHKLKEEWREITGGSHVMHLEKMFGLDKNGNKTWKLNKRGLREIVKYATKADNFCGNAHLVEEFLSAFENVRRVQAFGSFLGTMSEEKETSELVGCSCGECHWSDGRINGPEYHISQTVLTFPGEHRQLRLFDSGHDPPTMPFEDYIDGDTYARREMETANASQFALPGVLPQQEWIGFMSTASRSNG